MNGSSKPLRAKSWKPDPLSPPSFSFAEMMGQALTYLSAYNEGTNITGKRGVNPHRMQLNDALIEFYALNLIESLYPLARETEARM